MQLTNIGVNPHGTRVIQKIVDKLHTEELMKTFIKVLKPHTVNLVKDLNGNHIILKVLNCYDPALTTPLFETLNNHLMEVSLHKHGCCVLQKCIDSASPEIKNYIIMSILQHIPELITDQFGNYILQYVMTLGDTNLVGSIAKTFFKDMIFLSKQKYSSNVVEKVYFFNISALTIAMKKQKRNF